MITRNQAGALFMVLLVTLYYLFQGGSQSLQPAVTSHDDHVQEVTSKQLSQSHNRRPSSAPQKPAPVRPANAEKQNFSYQKEIQQLNRLASQWPRSKAQLMARTLKSDAFKKAGQQPKPHSLGDIQQNQMGALKVMAIREIIARETNLVTLRLDLTFITQNAKDPTIRKIADAAIGSLDQGRSFIDDFVDGMGRLPAVN